MSVSPRQLADAIGVSESSVKRWADEGRIPTVRTAGGHRRIALEQALAFTRSAGHDLLRPEVLGLEGLGPIRAGRTEVWIESLEGLLRRGRRAEFEGALLAAYLGGASIASLCDGPLRAAFAALGELWRDDPAGVFVEHRATLIALGALARLRRALPVPANAPVALGGSTPGDPSQLPSAMAAAVLAAEGFDTVDLGADTPASAFIAACREHAPRLVWIGANHGSDDTVAARAVDEIAEETTRMGIPCVLGGRVAGSLRLKRRTLLRPVASMAELAAFGRGLAEALPGR